MEFLEEIEDRIYGPTHWTFEDWTAAGEWYAITQFPDWHPKMVERFGGNLAWRMEGELITPVSLAEASDDWFSGQSPYSPHTVPLAGYDIELWGETETKKAVATLYAYGIEQGLHESTADRFAHDSQKYFSITFLDYDIEFYWEQWVEGFNTLSPHHIPFEEDALIMREVRRQSLRERYTGASNSSFDIFFSNNRLTVDEFTDKALRASIERAAKRADADESPMDDSVAS